MRTLVARIVDSRIIPPRRKCGFDPRFGENSGKGSIPLLLPAH
jgi:hypothetical protein